MNLHTDLIILTRTDEESSLLLDLVETLPVSALLDKIKFLNKIPMCGVSCKFLTK